MITILTAISAAPYAAGLGLFLLGYFLIFPYIEYLRDPKGISNALLEHIRTTTD